MPHQAAGRPDYGVALIAAYAQPCHEEKEGMDISLHRKTIHG